MKKVNIMKKKVYPVMAGYRGLGEDRLNEILEKIDDINRSYDFKNIKRALFDIDDVLTYDCDSLSDSEAKDVWSKLQSNSELMDVIFACTAVSKGFSNNIFSKR